MTLIAAFRCSEGVVICADSQETLGIPQPAGYAEYRVSVDKIEPLEIGNYETVIGGAGNGPLVDGFTEVLTDQIATWPATLDGPALKDKLRLALLDYHRNEVALCPAEDKDIHFLVCLKQRDNPAADIHLWDLRGTAIHRVTKYSLIGWEEAIYQHDVQQLYREGARSLYAMLVGIHVLVLAKATSNHIGGPTKIVVASPLGFRAISPEDTAELDRRVSEFDSVIDRLRLRVCDTTVPLDDFSNDASAFQTTILNLRLTLTDNIILTKLHRLQSVKTVEDVRLLYDPYLGLPDLEECTRALRASWNSVTTNRRSRRDLSISSLHLSYACAIVTDLISPAYKQGAITLEQRQGFAKRLFDINQAGKSVLDELGKLESDPPHDAQVDGIYTTLTAQVVDPLLAVANDFGKLFEGPNERGNEIIRGIHATLLSIFTTAFVAPFSKEPPSLLSPPKQLDSGIDGKEKDDES